MNLREKIAAPSSPCTLTARWIVPIDRPPLPHGTATIADDRILAVEPHGRVKADVDLGNRAVLPGFVNAHTHLDLTGLRGRLAPGPDFVAWLRGVVKYRRSRTPEEVHADIRAGIAESLAHGTTLIGDISASGASWAALNDSRLRAVVFHELLGLPSDRAREALRQARAWLQEHPPTPTCRPGLSPHAPYSVSKDLLTAVMSEARSQDVPLAIHVAETRLELELLRHHRGPLVEFLSELGVWCPEALVASEAEVVRGGGLLVHGNYLSPDDLPPGQSLVYCPRTHAAFGHEPYPLTAFLAAGARVALGTDSLASNPDLSVLEEARTVRRAFPEISPHDILRMATLAGAEALGWSSVTGSLTPGKVADMVVIALGDETGDPCEQVLTGTERAEPALRLPTKTAKR